MQVGLVLFVLLKKKKATHEEINFTQFSICLIDLPQNWNWDKRTFTYPKEIGWVVKYKASSKKEIPFSPLPFLRKYQ